MTEAGGVLPPSRVLSDVCDNVEGFPEVSDTACAIYTRDFLDSPLLASDLAEVALLALSGLGVHDGPHCKYSRVETCA